MHSAKRPNRQAIIAEIRYQMQYITTPGQQAALQRCLDFWLHEYVDPNANQ